MSVIKVSVTITIPGRVMMTSQECDENPQKNYDSNTVSFLTYVKDKKTKKKIAKKETLYFLTRKSHPAFQTLNICEESYDYMISNSCPEWFTGGTMKWKKLSATEKLEAHLQRTCEHLGGLDFNYIVFED